MNTKQISWHDGAETELEDIVSLFNEIHGFCFED